MQCKRLEEETEKDWSSLAHLLDRLRVTSASEEPPLLSSAPCHHREAVLVLLPCAYGSPMGLVNEFIPTPGVWLQHTAADFALGRCCACTCINSFISDWEILQRNRDAFCLYGAWVVSMHACSGQ